jgi:hypothetical protein
MTKAATRKIIFDSLKVGDIINYRNDYAAIKQGEILALTETSFTIAIEPTLKREKINSIGLVAKLITVDMVCIGGLQGVINENKPDYASCPDCKTYNALMPTNKRQNDNDLVCCRDCGKYFESLN